MSGSASALWTLAGYVVSVLIFAVLVVAIFFVLRRTIFRRGRIHFAGWAPWWYMGGQPDVPDELQRDRPERTRDT